MTIVRSSLNSAIIALRKEEGIDGFSQLTEFLQQFHNASMAGKIRADSEKFNPIFQEILVAQAQRESKNLADILEFQLSPLLS